MCLFGCIFLYALVVYFDPVAKNLRYYFSMPDHDYLPEMQQLAEDGKILEAIHIGNLVIELRDMPNEDQIRLYTQELEAEYGKFSRRLKDSVIGFITGKGESTESIVAKTISDFLLIGDIRDLGMESWKEARDDDGDKVIMALSAAGLAASVATFVPEPTTTGAGVAAQPTLTAFKVLRRMGALTAKFGDELVQLMQKVKRTKSFAPAAKAMNSLGTLVKAAPAGSVPDLMRTVESSGDLALVSKKVAENPNTVSLFLRCTGGNGLDLLRVGGKKVDDNVRIMVRKGVRSAPKLRPRVRGGKIPIFWRIGPVDRSL